jgi:hypothetical protein
MGKETTAESEGENIVEYLARNASYSMKNPIVDVLANLVSGIDHQATCLYKPLYDIKEGEKGVIDDQFPDWKEGTENFVVFELTENHRKAAFAGNQFLPVGALTISVNEGVLEHTAAGAKTEDSLNAQMICVALFYSYIKKRRGEYVKALGVEGADRVVEAFLKFFEPYPMFVERCDKLNLY